jgi:hypothetical protein
MRDYFAAVRPPPDDRRPVTPPPADAPTLAEVVQHICQETQ